MIVDLSFSPFNLIGCCSVTQLCSTLCNPVDCSTSGFPVLHHLPEFYSNSCPLSQWCHPTISSSVTPFSSCIQSFPGSVFQWVCSSHQVAKVLEIQLQHQSFQWILSWSPLGWTGWISLLPKGLSRVFSNTTVWRLHSSVLSLFYSPILTSIHDYWKNHILTVRTFVSKVMSLLFNMLCRFVTAFINLFLVISLISFCLTRCDTLLLGTHTHLYMSSWWISPFIIK